MTQDHTNAISNIDHNLPDLPSEILYKILDEAYEVRRQSSISSIALVCHSFRIHSNKYRFAKLGLEGDDNTLVPKVHALQDLIKSEAKSSDEEGMVGFTSFVKSFSISPSGPNYRQTLDDRSLAFIIRNLFLPSQDRNVYPSGTSRQFSLSPIVNRDKLLLWPSLNDDLVSAFYALCKKSLLSSLALACIVDLPSGLLSGSNISNLSLAWMNNHDVSKAVHSDSTSKTSIPPLLLKFLDIHHTVSLPEIMNIVSNGASKPDSVFSCLTTFNTLIRHEASYQTTHTIFSAAKNLQEVTVFAFGLKKGSKESFPSMDYSQISSLQSLTVQLNVSQWRDTPGKYIADTLITLVGDVGKHPPNLTCIKVIVEEFVRLMGHRSITDLFRGFRALDTHLSNLGFMGRIVVHVRFGKMSSNYGELPYMWNIEQSLKNVFPRIQETPNIITEIIAS